MPKGKAGPSEAGLSSFFAKPFECLVPGKWVLAGEHSVLRGSSAVALPHPQARLSLRFEPAPRGAVSTQGNSSLAPHSGCGLLRIEPRSAAPIIGPIVEQLLGSESGLGTGPQGLLTVTSTIPLGAGLGSSAALSVALARWLAVPLGLAPEAIFGLARSIEDRFHGKSSGMDVAAALAGSPIIFSMREGAVPLDAAIFPEFSFHDTGLRAPTRDCIVQVEKLRREQPGLAERLDGEMALAAQSAARGLVAYGAAKHAAPAAPSTAALQSALSELARAMTLAQGCFRQWGLLPPEAAELERQLLAEGALAVKLTGAGGGGFLVALWDSGSPAGGVPS
jgi:mevalonate kinase